ncbi:MAG TPA: FkbM family methyltransferase [Vicinamibacterales bacterium]|nr:FkbM family methyltransferase [Vicinamibacterales bacterium]
MSARVLAAVVPRLPFGRYRLMHALRRWPLAPFVAALPPDLGGMLFHCDLGDSIAREACFTGRYEPQETQVAASLVQRGDTVVDVGANWGYFTLAAAHWAGAAGRVIAMEPEPRLFALLAANIALNRLPHVNARRIAAGAGPGSMDFVAYDARADNRGVSRAAGAAEPSDFRSDVVALDSLFDGARIDRVRLVKIDIEGGEYEALQGMSAGLAADRYDYVLIECHPALLAGRGISVRQCLEPLVAARYRLLDIDQSPDAYRRSARGLVPTQDLLRRFDADAALGAWPHLLAVSPSAVMAGRA